LPRLVEGVLVLPRLRTAFASMALPNTLPVLVSAALPVLALTLPARIADSRALLGAAAVVLALALLAAGSDDGLYARIFAAVRATIPVATVAGAVALARTRATPERRVAVFAALATAALCALVQFPFGAGIYFCYVAPLAAVAAAAVLSLRRTGPGPMAGLLLVFFLAYAGVWMNRGFIFFMGEKFRPSGQTEVLRLPRAGGIRVLPQQAAYYRAMVDELHRRTRGPYIYAGPDAPEVYFLAGYRNPTPQLFEFFDEPTGHDRRLLEALDRHKVEAIALNLRPDFSPFPGAPMMAELRARYPHAVQMSRFVVAWREPGDPPRAAPPAGAPR
jgi:hypothetical protein